MGNFVARTRQISNLHVKNICTTCRNRAINITSRFKYGLVREKEYRNEDYKNERRDGRHGPTSGDLLECTEGFKNPHQKNQTQIDENLRSHNKNKLRLNVKGEILFGIHPILLALKSKRRSFQKLYLKQNRAELHGRLVEIAKMAEKMNLPIELTSRKLLDQLSGQRPHQNVCMDCGNLETQFYETSEMETNEPKRIPVWLLLDRIKDPMNLGAIIRTAYFVGVRKILSAQTDACPLTPVVSKASSGAMEIAPYFYVRSATEFLKFKRAKGWEIVGTVADDEPVSSINLTDFELSKPTVLVVGNEGDGLDSEVLKLCTNKLSLKPGRQHSERISSLNVSVATGIILHTILKNQF